MTLGKEFSKTSNALTLRKRKNTTVAGLDNIQVTLAESSSQLVAICSCLYGKFTSIECEAREGGSSLYFRFAPSSPCPSSVQQLVPLGFSLVRPEDKDLPPTISFEGKEVKLKCVVVPNSLKRVVEEAKGVVFFYFNKQK